jgi:hypothetical protein
MLAARRKSADAEKEAEVTSDAELLTGEILA